MGEFSRDSRAVLSSRVPKGVGHAALANSNNSFHVSFGFMPIADGNNGSLDSFQTALTRLELANLATSEIFGVLADGWRWDSHANHGLFRNGSKEGELSGKVQGLGTPSDFLPAFSLSLRLSLDSVDSVSRTGHRPHRPVVVQPRWVR